MIFYCLKFVIEEIFYREKSILNDWSELTKYVAN